MILSRMILYQNLHESRGQSYKMLGFSEGNLVTLLFGIIPNSVLYFPVAVNTLCVTNLLLF